LQNNNNFAILFLKVYFLSDPTQHVSELISTEANDIIKFLIFKLKPDINEIDPLKSRIQIFPGVNHSDLLSGSQTRESWRTLMDEISTDCQQFGSQLLNEHQFEEKLFIKILNNTQLLNTQKAYFPSKPYQVTPRDLSHEAPNRLSQLIEKFSELLQNKTSCQLNHNDTL
jgi:hypothetical protein